MNNIMLVSYHDTLFNEGFCSFLQFENILLDYN